METNIKHMPFFSIVMPAYGVERYIERAINSIVEQTFSDWELIVVDDCTPDKSGEIAASIAQNDARIRVVRHEENRGLSAARNTGLKAASGKYIWFMDSDDYVERELLYIAHRSVLENPAQLIVFGLLEEYFDRKGAFSYSHEVKPKEGYFSDKESLRKEIIYLEQATLYGYAWNKLYDLEYLRSLNLKYEKVTLIEDIIFNIKFCMDIESMNLIPDALYHYQKRLDDSLTNKFVPDYYVLHKRRIEMLYEQYRYWDLCTDTVKEILGSLYVRYILSALQRNCDKRSKMTHTERYKWCRGLFGQELFNTLIPFAKTSESRSLKAAILILRRKNTMWCLAMGRMIYAVKGRLPMLYTKVKSGR